MKTEIYNKIVQERTKYAEFIKENCTIDNAAIILTEIMSEYELDFITFVGYTPSFNDGEPCEHSSYVVTDQSENSEHFGFDEFHGADYEDHDYKLHVEDENLKYNEKVEAWSRDYRINIENIKSMDEKLEVVEFIFEQEYMTNYKVFVFVNKNDEIEIVQEEYYDY